MWRPNEVGEVFAERHLKFTKGRRSARVRLTIGRPVKGPETGDPWWCSLFLGKPFNKFQPIAGEDSLQCLVLALEYADETLPSLARRAGGRMEWLGEHARLVFGGTDSGADRWNAVANLIGGLADAVKHLENGEPLSNPLSRRLRALVASHGASDRVVAAVEARVREAPARRKRTPQPRRRGAK